MAKKVMGSLKLQVKAGQANPSPPIGPALGQRGINIMEFCKAFSFEMKTAPDSFFLKKAAGLKPVGKRNRAKGSMKPGREVAGTVTVAQVRQIAEAKMKDLSANDIEAAMKIIVGSAKSIGIEVKG
ncbi:MAG: 50S ribosomal protein L11 [Rhodobacteraceae bacterium]|nr:50S ribosomal protein L11 [Paracoccaceae bacterium]